MRILFILILSLIIFLFFACVSLDKYQTYEIKGVPSNYEILFVPFLWKTEFFNGSQVLKIYNNSNNSREFREVIFQIKPQGKLENGVVLGSGDETKYIFTEPYNFYMQFRTFDTKKIIFNKMLFHSKNDTIDLRQKLRVSNPHVANDFINEEKLIEFRNNGEINLEIINSERQDSINSLSFEYENIDIVNKSDRYFTIEYNITFINDLECNEIENYSFTVKYNRKKFSERGAIAYYFLSLFFKI